MPLFTCAICGKEFKNRTNKNKFRVCSNECFKALKKNTKYPNKINILDDCAEIIISSKRYGNFKALIDKTDISICEKITWGIATSGRLFYVRGKQRIDNKWENITLHRYIMKPTKEMEIDHINRNPLDNRRVNLRICTRQENNQNKGVYYKNTGKLKGAYFSKKENRWYSVLIFNNENIWLGTFKTELEAHNAYINAKKERGIICKETIDKLQLAC